MTIKARQRGRPPKGFLERSGSREYALNEPEETERANEAFSR